MPTYRTKTATSSSSKKGLKKARNYPKRLPRDPAKLFRWAARGSLQDYEKLRRLARKARHSLPTYIDGEAFSRITEVDRLRMIEEIQASEQHEISAGWFLDGINWLLDKVPWGNWNWMVSAAQSGINSQKGDGLNEVDEQYARLVGATYGSVQDRPFVIDHWRRQVQFDSEYVSVWDNPDGHRLIAVRGTQGTGKDIGEDILVGLTGDSTDVIGSELLQILAATPQGVVVDLAAHDQPRAAGVQPARRVRQHPRDLPVQPRVQPPGARPGGPVREGRERALLHQHGGPGEHGRDGALRAQQRRVPQRARPHLRAQTLAVARAHRVPRPDLPRPPGDPRARAQSCLPRGKEHNRCGA